MSESVNLVHFTVGNDMTHSYVGHDSSIHRDETHPYVRHDSLMCAT